MAEPATSISQHDEIEPIDVMRFGRAELPSLFNPNLERLPMKYLHPKHVQYFRNNPTAVAKLLIQSYEGEDGQVQNAARLARRVLQLLEYQLHSRNTDFFVDSASAGQTSEVRRRLNTGQDVDAKHSLLGHAAIHIASALGYFKIVKILVAHNADLCLKRNKDGNTPLHCAASHGQVKVLQYLIAHGADKRMVNQAGFSPYDLAHQGNFNDAAAVLRSPPSCPLDPGAFNIESRSAVFRWKQPQNHHGAVDTYHIELIPVDGMLIKLEPELKDKPQVFVVQGGETSKFVFPENILHPKTRYNVLIRAHNASGLGDTAELVVMETLSDVPGVNDGVVPLKISCTSVELGWDVPRNNNGAIVHNYELQVQQMNNKEDPIGKWEVLEKCMDGSEMIIVERDTGRYREDREIQHVEYKATNLKAGTNHRLRVRARNDVGWGDWSPISQVIRTRPPIVPIEVHARSVVVGWGDSVVKKDRVVVDHWQMQLKVVSKFRAEWEDVGTEIDGPQTSLRVPNLVPSTTYVFRIRAFRRKIGYNSWGDCAVAEPITTQKACPEEPGVPVSHDRTHESIDVSWKAALDNGETIDKYCLRYSPVTISRSWHIASAEIIGTKYTVHGLDPGTDYYFMVRAHNALGWGNFSSSSKTESTMPTCPPDPPVVVQRAATYLIVEWSMRRSKGAPILGFELERRVFATGAAGQFDSEEDWKRVPCELAADSAQCMVDGLAPVSEYSFRVRALTKLGWSHFSEPSERARTTRRN